MNFTFGICLLSVVPLRKEPQERSEMISQILFGELFHILDSQPKWTYIKCNFDNYEGWIDSKTITLLPAEEYNDLSNAPINIIDKLIIAELDEETFRLLPGSIIYNYNRKEHLFSVGLNIFRNVNYEQTLRTINSISKNFINVPYLWGGKSEFGIDCSGFTQTVFKIFGKTIPRDSNQQVRIGETVPFVKEAIEGDLAFFDDEEGKINHVGILLNNSEIIHASGFVKIDAIDHQGIFNRKERKYSHKLRVIKRILEKNS